MKEILEHVRCSVGDFKQIDESNITISHPYSGVKFDVRSGDKIKGKREGTLTILARHCRSSDPRMYGITCEHVLSDDPNEYACLYACDCVCPSPSRNCDCSYRNPIMIGKCVYKMSPHDKNPMNSDLIDIACFLIPQHVEQKCDLRIFGPKNGMRIVNPCLPLDGSRVFMRGPYDDVSYGRYIGHSLLLPGERRHDCHLDSQPQSLFQIPHGGLPRRVELVESEDGRRLGHSGYSGSLISILETTTEGVIHMRPALVYLGQWPENPTTISMCSRLPDSLERLSEKYPGKAEFALCFDNSSHERANMRSNPRKRKAE